MSLTDAEHNALLLLAKRRKLSDVNWWEPSYNPFGYKCVLCGAIFENARPINRHALIHLKEIGLLVFS